ncbi:MAG: ABC transporter permease [Chloroflexota bacterium]|nr:ABC transporter permease [Chloroflexota bacterium]
MSDALARVSPREGAGAGDAERARVRTPPPRLGWLVVARKEFADHLLSLRFLVLLVVLAAAAAIPLYFASGRIRDLASQASGAPAVFLAQFTLGSQDIPFLRVDLFVGILGPLLGLAFGFDAVNSERSEGTLPRLLAQPIHRDDVINGKFAAGLAVIGLVLVALTASIAGFGLVRLGIVPAPSEVIRIVLWLAVTIVYVGFWLAFGTVLSVVVRRAATSALIGFGIWLAVTIFGQLIVTLIAGLIAAPTGSSVEDVLRSAQLQQLITRLLPSTLYQEVSVVILNPTVTQISAPVTLGQLQQAQEQIPTLLSLDQSLLLVWPHVVVLIALTVASFAVAYIQFMRQEVRA